MGKQAPSSPAPVDPYASANAQLGLNKGTASYTAALDRTNSSGPYGSQSWQITGYSPDGAPIYTQNTSLNAAGATALGNQQQNQVGATGLAGDLLGNSSSLLTNPLDPTGINQKAAAAAFNSNMDLIRPQQQQATEALQSQLAAQGITDPNSEAYKQATGNLQRQQDWQNNNLANQSVQTGIQAGQTAFGQDQAAQQQALAMFSGLNSQNIGMPSGAGSASPTAASPDIMGAMQNQYNGQIANNNAQVATNNANTTGLVGLASIAAYAF